jgi:hypothetical protein
VSGATIGGYWPGWLTCGVCGLTDKDVRETNHPGVQALCCDALRCQSVRRGEALGGKPWNVTKGEP